LKREREIRRKMASSNSNKKKLEEGASPTSTTKKAKVEKPPAKEKVVQSDYMPKEYPAELYPSAPTDHVKIVSWNVNGLNACYNKGFKEYVSAEAPDILVLQETKLQAGAVKTWAPKMEELGFTHNYWSCSGEKGGSKKGYASVAVLSKTAPNRVIYGLLDESTADAEEGVLNDEGRTITTEFDNFFLVNSYVPNSGQKLERLTWRGDTWDASMLVHLQTLEAKGKPVIFTGDLNVAHTALDVKNDKSNYNKTAGYTQTEIDGFQRMMDAGFIDAWRSRNPEEEAYTYFGMRFNSYASNSGWRIDYFVCSKDIDARIESTHIRKQVYGASDHVPILMHLAKK
jgi:exodeoxyribonuclease III